MKKRKWIRLALVTAMMATMFSGCGSKNTGSTESEKTTDAAVTESEVS